MRFCVTSWVVGSGAATLLRAQPSFGVLKRAREATSCVGRYRGRDDDEVKGDPNETWEQGGASRECGARRDLWEVFLVWEARRVLMRSTDPAVERA